MLQTKKDWMEWERVIYRVAITLKMNGGNDICIDFIQLDGLDETDRSLKLEFIQINHNHKGRTFDRCIIKSETIKSGTRSRFWRYPEIRPPEYIENQKKIFRRLFIL